MIDSLRVRSLLSNWRLSTLNYGLVYGKHYQKDLIKCAKTRVIITHFLTSRFDHMQDCSKSYEHTVFKCTCNCVVITVRHQNLLAIHIAVHLCSSVHCIFNPVAISSNHSFLTAIFKTYYQNPNTSLQKFCGDQFITFPPLTIWQWLCVFVS